MPNEVDAGAPGEQVLTEQDLQERLGSLEGSDADVAASNEAGEQASQDEATAEPAAEDSATTSEDEAKDDGEPQDAADAVKPEEPKHGRDRSAEGRIGELTAKLKAKDEELASTRARLESIDVETARAIPLPASRLTKEEAAAIREANEVISRKQWLLQRIGTGFEHPTDPSKNLSTAEIGAELAELEARSDTVAEARLLYRERHKQFLADAQAGMAARLKAGQKPTLPLPKTPAKTPGAAARPAVKIPGPVAGGASRPVAKPAVRPGIDLKRFDEATKKHGAGRALEMALADL